MNSPPTDGAPRPLIVIFCEPDRHYLEKLDPVIGGRQVARHAVAAPLLWVEDATLSRYEDVDAVVVVSSWLIASGLVFSESFRGLIDKNRVVSVVVQECNWGGTPIIETPVLALPLNREVCQSALSGDRVTAAKTDMVTPNYDHPEHLVVGERLAALYQLWGIAAEGALSAAIARVEAPLSLAHGWVPGRIIANRFRLVSRSTGISQFSAFRAWDLKERREVWVQSLPMVAPHAQRTLEHLRHVSLALAEVVSSESPSLVPTVIVPISHEQGVAYRVTAFAKGVSLAEANVDTHCRVTKLLRVRRVVRALSVAHGHGIAHGFLSPARIRLGLRDDDTVVFLGFGIHRHTFSQADMTFIAPEVLSGKFDATVSADVYSVAMLVCVALVGEDHGQRLLSDSLTVLSEADLSSELVALLQRGIAFESIERPLEITTFLDEVLQDEKLLREFVAAPVTSETPGLRRDALLSLLSRSPDTSTARQLSDVQRTLGDDEGSYGAALLAIELAEIPSALQAAITHILTMLDEPRSKTVLAILPALPASLQSVASGGRAMILDEWGTLDERVEAWSDAFARHQTRDQADCALRGICTATKELGAVSSFIAWSELRLPFTHGTTRSHLLIELAAARGSLSQVDGCVEAACLAIDQGANFDEVMPSLHALPIHECWQELVDPLISWAPVDTTGMVMPLLSTVASVARMSNSSKTVSLHQALSAAQPENQYATDYLVQEAFERAAYSEVLSLIAASPHAQTSGMVVRKCAALIACGAVEDVRAALASALLSFPTTCAILEFATYFSLSIGEADQAFGYAQRRVSARADAHAYALLADASLWCGLTAHAARNYQLAQEHTPGLKRVSWGVAKVAGYSADELPKPWYAISLPTDSPAMNVAKWLSERVAISSLVTLVSHDVLGLAGQQRHKELSRLAVATMVVELHAIRGTLLTDLFPLLSKTFSDCSDELSADIEWTASHLQAGSLVERLAWCDTQEGLLDGIMLKPRLSLVEFEPPAPSLPDAPMPPTILMTCRVQISTGEIQTIDEPMVVGGGEEDDWVIEGLPPRAFRLAYCGGMLYATAENGELNCEDAVHQELCVTLTQRFTVSDISFSVRAPSLELEIPTSEPPRAAMPVAAEVVVSTALATATDIEGQLEEPLVYRAELVIDDGTLLGSHFALSDQRIQIGTAISSDLVLTDETISPVHCVIVKQDGVWNIEDRAGSGSTRVNDRAIVFHRLEPGDHITIGLVEIEFHLVALRGTGRQIS